jgi:hypothetical protein
MIKKEAVGAKPFYCVGDMVTNSYGGKGVIVKAETNTLTERPQYAVKWITNFQNGVGWSDTRQWIYAWWEAHEWADVELGLVHKMQEGVNESHDA